MNFKTYFTDLLNLSIVVGALVMLAVMIILIIFFSSRVSTFKDHKGKFYSYLVVLLLVSALVTFVGSSEIFNGQLFGIFIFYQLAFFVLGIVHVYVYRLYLNKFEQKSIWMEMFFALIMALCASLPLILVFTIAKGSLYAYNMALSVLVFIVPTLIYTLFESAVSIPPKRYETWLFPEGDAFPPPDDSEFRDVVLLTCLFYKNPKSDMRTEFTAKAPVRMDFDRVFYHFVNDYNLRNPDGPISLVDENGERQHWIFYAKSSFWGFVRFITPRFTLYMNGIRDNCTIICQRVSKEVTQEDMREITENADFSKGDKRNTENSPKEEVQKENEKKK